VPKDSFGFQAFEQRQDACRLSSFVLPFFDLQLEVFDGFDTI
jgi:hypothetical protein